MLPAALALVTMASGLVVSGCTALGPWLRDSDEPATEPREPEPPAHEHAVDEGPGPGSALEVAVLDPSDYERGISRRKRALAGGAADEPLSPGDTGYYLDVQEAQLRQALSGSGIGLFREHLDMRLRIPGTEAFETGSSQLNPAIRARLATVAEVLEDYRLTLVIVHGHTDASGDAVDNQRLSEMRAIAVARQLVEHGLAPERIVTIGHGESRPLAHDTSPESRWPDRRIEIQLELVTR